MKKTIAVAGLLILAGSVPAYLALIGYDERLEAESTGNVVVFSSAALAQEAVGLSGAFPLRSNVGSVTKA